MAGPLTAKADACPTTAVASRTAWMPAWGRNARGERLGFSWRHIASSELPGQVEIPLGQTCSPSSNRIVRTRPATWCGGRAGRPAWLPDYPAL